MHNRQFLVQARQSVGVVHRVDTVNRELTVLVQGEPVVFDVPVNCTIVLHGERVRFRMLQPLDVVRVAHARQGNLRIASAIEVRSDPDAG